MNTDHCMISGAGWKLINAQLLTWTVDGLINASEFSVTANDKLLRLIAENVRGGSLWIDFRGIESFASRTVYEALQASEKRSVRKLRFISSGNALQTHLLRYPDFRQAGQNVLYGQRPVPIVRRPSKDVTDLPP